MWDCFLSFVLRFPALTSALLYQMWTVCTTTNTGRACRSLCVCQTSQMSTCSTPLLHKHSGTLWKSSPNESKRISFLQHPASASFVDYRVTRLWLIGSPGVATRLQKIKCDTHGLLQWYVSGVVPPSKHPASRSWSAATVRVHVAAMLKSGISHPVVTQSFTSGDHTLKT